MAKCTNVTYLMHEKADAPGTFEKLIDITEYPDLGGEKEKLDVTTLSDTKKRTINGIEDTGDLAFKAWYEKADYKKLLDLQEAGKVDKYQLWFGEEGVDGKWEWPVLWQYIRQADLPTMREKCHSPLLMRAKRLFIM